MHRQVTYNTSNQSFLRLNFYSIASRPLFSRRLKRKRAFIWTKLDIQQKMSTKCKSLSFDSLFSHYSLFVIYLFKYFFSFFQKSVKEQFALLLFVHLCHAICYTRLFFSQINNYNCFVQFSLCQSYKTQNTEKNILYANCVLKVLAYLCKIA